MNQKNLATIVANRIKGEIEKGRFPPGSKLPSERDLASLMGFSRASVREGLQLLKSTDIVEARTGIGTFVACELGSIDQALTSDLFLADKRELLEDLFGVRIVLEAQIAAWAAERANDDEIKKLDDVLSEMEAAISRGETGAIQDIVFHDYIARASRSRVVMRIMSAIWEHLQESRQHSLSIPGQSEISLKAHKDIYNAIRNRDPKEAKECMRHHLEQALGALRQYGFK